MIGLELNPSNDLKRDGKNHLHDLVQIQTAPERYEYLRFHFMDVSTPAKQEELLTKFDELTIIPGNPTKTRVVYSIKTAYRHWELIETNNQRQSS